jgi:hypothetical protein
MVSAKVGSQRPGFSIRLSVIDGLADRFLYFNDDMMLVAPVKSTDFFSNEGKVNLRGRWNNLDGKRDKEISFFDGT